MSEQLEPCPFCGGEAYAGTIDNDMPIHYARCCECEAEVGGSDVDDAIYRWNTRVSPPPSDTRNNVLEEALRRILNHDGVSYRFGDEVREIARAALKSVEGE